MTLRLISASHLDQAAFAARSLLGQSLQHPAHSNLPRTIHTGIRTGLPELYNQALRNCSEDILLFCHDDLALPPEVLEPLLQLHMDRFAIAGLYGNTRDQGHLSWHRRPNGEGWDFPYLRGAISTRSEGTKRRDVFGITNTPVQLIDGVLIAVQRQQLLDHGVGFDPRFHFHFYDLDLCRTARRQGLSIGVIRLDCIHASRGEYGSAAWREEAECYCQKWQLPFVNPKSETNKISELPTGIQKPPPAAFEQGRIAYRAGRYLEAEAAFAQAVNQAPDHLLSWLQWANSQRRQGFNSAAITTLQKLTQQLPNAEEGWQNLGLLHQQQGNQTEARHALENLVALQRKNPNHIGLLADALVQDQALDDAESLLRAATHGLGQQPKAVGLWHRLAHLLAQRGDKRKALIALQNGLQLVPSDSACALARATLLLETGQPEAALQTVNALLGHQPHEIAALQRKAEILQFMGELEASLALCRQGLQQEPQRLELLLLEIYACQGLCQWSMLDAQLNRIIHLLHERGAPSVNPGHPIHQPLPPFGLVTLPLPLALQHQELNRWVLANGHRPPQDHQPKLPTVHGERRPLRMGYLSADFRSHAMGLLLEGLFEAHDPNQACTYAYGISPIQDQLTEHYRSTADYYRDLERQSDNTAIDLIRCDELDVLIDLTGLTTFSRPAIACARPAAMVLNYLGFPGSQGNYYVDGLIADDQLIPIEQEAQYHEKVLRLPHAFASRWRKPLAGISRSSYELPDEAFVFCCFNRSDKINASTFSSWMDILEAVPNSLLWLAVKPQALKRLKAQAQMRGINPDRLVAAPYQKPVERFIAAMSCADLFLDTAGFNAGAIGVLALNAGLPLLTITGDRFCARMGASLCQAVHQKELITTSLSAYQHKAIEIATTSGAIDQLKSQLCTRPRDLPMFQQQLWVNQLMKCIEAA